MEKMNLRMGEMNDGSLSSLLKSEDRLSLKAHTSGSERYHHNEGIDLARKGFMCRLVEGRENSHYENMLDMIVLKNDYSLVQSLEDIIYLVYKEPKYIITFREVVSDEYLVAMIMHKPELIIHFGRYMESDSILDLISCKPEIVKYIKRPKERLIMYFLSKADAPRIMDLTVQELLSKYNVDGKELINNIKLHYKLKGMSLKQYKRQMLVYRELLSKEDYNSMDFSTTTYDYELGDEYCDDIAFHEKIGKKSLPEIKTTIKNSIVVGRLYDEDYTNINLENIEFIKSSVSARRTKDYLSNIIDTKRYNNFDWVESIEDLLFLLHKCPNYIQIFHDIVDEGYLVDLVLFESSHMRYFEKYINRPAIRKIIGHKPSVVRYLTDDYESMFFGHTSECVESVARREGFELYLNLYVNDKEKEISELNARFCSCRLDYEDYMKLIKSCTGITE